MIDKVLAILIASLCLVVSALPTWADEGTPESEEGRYTFSKSADGFIRLGPSGAVVLCYVASFALLALALRGIELSIAYAVWSGVGTAVVAAIEEIAEQVYLKDRLRDRAETLGHGQKQWLEIGALLIQHPQLLLLDEPVAGMSVGDREKTAELLNSLSKGRAVVVVEHDMDFVKRIAHQVTVLHQGRVLAEGSMDLVQNDPRVIEVYLGH